MQQLRELTDRYRLEKILGSSRTGTVLRATDNQSGQAVAVKLINAGGGDPSRLAAFAAYASALSEVRHPAVPVVSDWGVTTEGSAFLVLELLVGIGFETLAGSPVRLLPLLIATVGGLEALAGRGLAHHNLSPDNLLVPSSREGAEVKLLGLGTAVLREPEAAAADLERARYRAPELSPAAGSPRGPAGAAGRADWRADIYSLALTTCHALGATVVLGDASGPSVQMPLALSFELDNDEALRQVLEHCLRQDPAERPGHQAVSEAFRLALGDAAPAPWHDDEAGAPAPGMTLAGLRPPDLPLLDDTLRKPSGDEWSSLLQVTGAAAPALSPAANQPARSSPGPTPSSIPPAPSPRSPGLPSPSLPLPPAAAAHPPAPTQQPPAWPVPAAPPAVPLHAGPAPAPQGGLEALAGALDLPPLHEEPLYGPPAGGGLDDYLELQAPGLGAPQHGAFGDLPAELFAAPVAAPSGPELPELAPPPQARQAPSFPNTFPVAPPPQAGGGWSPIPPAPPVPAGGAPVDAVGASAGEALSAIDDDLLNALAPLPPPQAAVQAPAAPRGGPLFGKKKQTAAQTAQPPAGRPAPAAAAGASILGLPRRVAAIAAAALAALLLLGVVILFARGRQHLSPGAPGAPDTAGASPPEQAAAAAAPPAAKPAGKTPEEKLREAKDYLALGKEGDYRVRAALRALSFGDQGALPPAACRELSALEETLAASALETLPQDLQTGLRNGDLGLLAGVVGAASEQDVPAAMRADFARAKSLVALYDQAEAAAGHGDHGQVLDLFHGIEALHKGVRDPLELRQNAAAGLESAAAGLARDGNYAQALAQLAPLQRSWPDRPGLRDLAKSLETAQRDETSQEALLQSLPAFERRRKPSEGLDLIRAIQPTPHLADQFAAARKRLEDELAVLDQQPPQVTLRDGYLLDYSRGTVVTLSFRVTDDYEVKSVKMLARAGAGRMVEMPLQKAGQAYTVDIPPSFHQNNTVEFYVVASDLSGHETYLGSKEKPLQLKRRQGFERMLGNRGLYP